MKAIMTAVMIFVCMTLPYKALATEASYQHTFKTTYGKTGNAQEGFINIGKSINCLYYSLPSEELDEDYTSRKSTIANDAMTYCEEPEPTITSFNHEEKTYQSINKAMMQSMHAQRDHMMRQMGVAPGSDQENDVFKSLGDKMGMVKQKQREHMEKAILEKKLPPDEHKKAMNDLNGRYPKAQANGAMQIGAKMTDLHKKGTSNGIACNWYQVKLSGMMNKETHMCAADWNAIPGGQRTRTLMYAFMNFMKEMSQGKGMDHNIYEVMQEIDKFRLISMTKDRNGQVISKEEYLGTKKISAQYTVPASYTEEDMMGGMMGEQNRPNQRQMNFPGMMDQTEPPQALEEEQGISSDRPQQDPEDMKKKVGDLLKGMGIGNLGDFLGK